MVALTVNGQRKDVTVDGNTPLLWILREHLKMTGTKFGCGIASCGACTVHIDGKAVRSCAMPVSLVEGKSITTIEGLSSDGSHPLLDIAERSNLSFDSIRAAADALQQNGLLRECLEFAPAEPAESFERTKS